MVRLYRSVTASRNAVLLRHSFPLLMRCEHRRERRRPIHFDRCACADTANRWTQFCQTYRGVCDTKPSPPLDVVLDEKAWNGLKQVNDWVNHNIKPMTDMDHYGMIQWWRYPDDGAGACHSYALLKRRLLTQAGWPLQALLMTIVHEANGEGHAVLTVETNRGEFILDNLTDDILLWSKTPYRYYKRQSQDDPNVSVWLDDMRADSATSSIRAR